MAKLLGRLSLAAWIVLVPTTQAAETQVEELLRLLRGGVGEAVAREWLEGATVSVTPTADELIALKTAGASDELLVALVRKAGPAAARPRHRVRRVDRVDRRTGRRVLELTNQAEDGSFPPAPPPPPKPAPEPEELRASLPGLLQSPRFVEAPVPVAAQPEPPRSSARLRIIPPRGPGAFWSANPPGHHMRFFGPDGYHFTRAEELYRRRPTYYIFDFDVPLFPQAPQSPAPAPAAGGYQPHQQLYQSRPVGFQHR